ncbi:hypothetical protein CC80DRAFT_253750 [Byssothecium circinans]|uniref:Uncharacterized protein n=1 Tax=Byssothecium circinans TaxID=147558 RepID=A0A6A5TAE9_9PLEO|nr:hypothetical protein CC80DRAFT_253750 [Byssothecium circinans]
MRYPARNGSRMAAGGLVGEDCSGVLWVRRCRGRKRALYRQGRLACVVSGEERRGFVDEFCAFLMVGSLDAVSAHTNRHLPNRTALHASPSARGVILDQTLKRTANSSVWFFVHALDAFYDSSPPAGSVVAVTAFVEPQPEFNWAATEQGRDQVGRQAMSGSMSQVYDSCLGRSTVEHE